MNPLPKSAFRNVFHKVRGFLNHWYDIYIYIYIYIYIFIYIYIYIYVFIHSIYIFIYYIYIFIYKIIKTIPIKLVKYY